MCVPTKLGVVPDEQWTGVQVEGHGYPYPSSLKLLLPSRTHKAQTFNLKAVATLSNGALSVSLHWEPGDTRIVGAFQIALEPRGERGEKLGVTVAEPKKLALLDGSGQWVPEVILPDNVCIRVFLLDRRLGANWQGDSPLVGLMFHGDRCPLASWRVTLWRWFSYWGMVRGIS